MEGRERLREGLQVLRPQVERLARDEELHVTAAMGSSP